MNLDEAAPLAAAPRRRAAGDPVKILLHRHRALCERAVDPLEIAAGLEARGITDRTAARFRHRDVFSLAEELYARTPRGEEPPAPPTAAPADARALRRFGLALLPGALACTAAAAAVPYAGAAVALAAATVLVLPGPPGRAAAGRARRAGRTPWAARAVLLLAAAAAGWAVHRHGTPLGIALALAAVPGHLAAALYTTRARHRLAASRALEDFADGARPLLLGTVAGFTLAAAGAALLAGAAVTLALPFALLFFLTRLLLGHGAPRGPVAAALALALVPAAAAVSAAAAGLLVLAVPVLARASAHARP
ncbi:hypothetical protein ACFVGY_09960 [Streptomyces sp. NPDC127106]|uniref:hypothetical protein n=1 Tax=Streptomyces sp. NPDC127106 TaxID=3345360 RepID=UPI003625378D